MSRWKVSLVLLAALCFSFTAWGETKSLLILHTNDLHDHIRPDYDGVGGLPYVAGYIKQVQESRKDLLVLDAGDVTEKGDMVAFVTKGVIMYEAMEKIGYTAATMGNHDFSLGIPQLRARMAKAPHIAWICRNYVDPAAAPSPTFLPSKIVDVQGLKVGIVGLTLPKDTKETLDMQGTARALADEVSRLRDQVHLLLVLGHLSSKDCARLSAAVPQVQVFVGGHSHELLKAPVVVPGTGALIVQAGQYARYVGRLELAVDTETKKLLRHQGSVVPMRHDAVPCDTAMRKWIRAREQEVCPQAAKSVGRADEVLTAAKSARLAVEGFLMCAAKAGRPAEVAICSPKLIMRSGLPQGDLDVNALFRTGGQRGHTLLAIELTGRQIAQYVEDMLNSKQGKPIWSGFRGRPRGDKDAERTVKTDLDDNRVYHVIMPELEWTQQCKPIIKGPPAPVARCPFTFTDAFAAYAEALTAEGKSLDKADFRLNIGAGAGAR